MCNGPGLPDHYCNENFSLFVRDASQVAGFIILVALSLPWYLLREGASRSSFKETSTTPCIEHREYGEGPHLFRCTETQAGSKY